MTLNGSKAPIELVEDGDDHPRKKRKPGDFPEKVYLTDDSDAVVSAKPKKRRAKRKSAGKRKSSDVHGDEAAVDHDIGQLQTPEYVLDRRRKFDANKRRHHDAALLLPPDYTDVGFDFGEVSQLENLEERPQFPQSSGIKPSRPYKDIELPLSAGLIPASIAQYLRDYQINGVSFLHRKFVYQKGAILGDDMGLGKTVQVAAFLTAAFGKTGDERDCRRMRQIRFCSGRWYPRILIICPGSLIMNWKNEMDRWGWWHVDVFHGPRKDDVLDTARAGMLEIMITTYDTYKNSRSSINMVQWDAIIADECHRLKDSSSETTKAMMEVNALCRIGLTGTAIQNNYQEMWTLLNWTNPGHFGTKAEWNERVSKPLTVGQSHDATAAQLSLSRLTAQKLVNNVLPDYFLRRMKTLIADQLPKKTDRVVFCSLTDLQRDAYTNFIESAEVTILRELSDPCEHGKKKGWCCHKYLPSGARWQVIVFPSIITLQKLSNHLTLMVPLTVDAETKHKSELNTLKTCLPDTWKELYERRDQIRNLVDPEFCGKWKTLKKLVKFWHGNGDKVLVFSHSVRLLRILQHLFTNTSYTVSYLDGSLSYEERQNVVDTYNSDPTQFVFLISTKAGGVGLNITSANKVVIVDPHWNPSYDLQAQDRAYRIGQTRDVDVFRLVSLGTVEEVVYARQIYKQQQANIGYTASSERRYFSGVQQDTERKGEIFGLRNLFTNHTDSGLLRDIVNKTNIAEAKAGVQLAEVDIEQAAKEEEELGIVKKEEADNDDGGLSQLAGLLTAEDPEKVLESRKNATPKFDAVQAILLSAGVEYTHDNSEVIGSSKVEEQLSRRATMMSHADGNVDGQSALFGEDAPAAAREALHSVYNPPEEVRLRQFCEMGREFGFASTTEFALLVESWTQEKRRHFLDLFYRRREEKLKGEGLLGGVKGEFRDEDGVQVKADPAAGDVVKSEADSNSLKSEDIKAEGTPIKDEGAVKQETVRQIKVEASSKMTSIFLSDDEDDEL